MRIFEANQWALILGGSSGFGLASAKKLSELGMNICIVHRDRKGAMNRINEQFEKICENCDSFLSFNLDALSGEGQTTVLEALTNKLKETGKIKIILHSIAFGNLKPIAPIQNPINMENAVGELASRLKIDKSRLQEEMKNLFDNNFPEFYPFIPSGYGPELIEDEDLARTVYSMGTSMLTWTQKVFQRNLFDMDARVIGLTSEGNEIAWRGYAAISAAKVALEAISRSIATEFAPYGIRSNVIQAGVTDTPALRAIPGSARMKAVAALRNPFKRLTTPEDVANVVALLSMNEAAWINGAIIRVDGGEHITSH